jgi:hypothetical protein
MDFLAVEMDVDMMFSSGSRTAIRFDVPSFGLVARAWRPHWESEMVLFRVCVRPG